MANSGGQIIYNNTLDIQILSKFGKLTVNTEIKKSVFKCTCDCGNIIALPKSSLKIGVKSCGCLRHGLRKSNNPIYNIWKDIKKRCYYKNHKFYHRYGGRGIKVCDEWKNDPLVFVEWSQKAGYQKGLEIDRIDNNGNYSPENCRFVTRKENCNNKNNNLKIEWEGEIYTLQEIIDHHGNAPRGCIVHRLKAGWKLKDAVLTPSRRA